MTRKPAPSGGRRRPIAGERRTNPRSSVPESSGRTEPIEASDTSESESTESNIATKPDKPAKPDKAAEAAKPDKAPTPAEETGADAVRRRGPRAPSGFVLALVGVVVVVLVLAAGFVGYRWKVAADSDRAETQAIAAAKKVTPKLLGWDYRDLDRQFAETEKLLSVGYRKQYAGTTERLTKQATKAKARVTAELEQTSVISATPDRVTLLVFVTQTTRKAGEKKPVVVPERVRMTIDRNRQGEWLLEKLAVV